MEECAVIDDAEGEPERPSRPAYLLDGRRVTIGDLLAAGLLRPGERLRFDRFRLGKAHHATVTEDGRVRLDDGQIFTTPSRAAVVAAGVRAFDGWHAWTVEQSGRYLDSLRQELLDQLAVQSGRDAQTTEQISSELQHRHDFLKNARAQATNDPVEIS